MTCELKKAKVRKGEVCRWDIQLLFLQFMGQTIIENGDPEYYQLAQDGESSEQVIWMVAAMVGKRHKGECYEACGSCK